MNKKKDLSGRKFYELTVLEKALSNNGKSKWLCECSCGNIKAIYSSNLMQGSTKSCGHILKEKYKNMKQDKGVRGLYILKNSYIRGAKSRNIYFELTDKNLFDLFKGNCYYCGIEPSHIKRDNSKNLSEETKDNGIFIYNGIDRVNNKLGYILSNCVSCCSVCNKAKHSQTKEEFENWINRLINYRKQK